MALPWSDSLFDKKSLTIRCSWEHYGIAIHHKAQAVHQSHFLCNIALLDNMQQKKIKTQNVMVGTSEHHKRKF
ncbi:hypothetical protein SE23_10085 [Vibrio sinaloensis]|nr:hypothetical protein SE23_10085 [Vibrio sinaloensis]